MSHSSTGSGSQGFSFVFSIVFIAEVVDGVGDNRSEGTAMVDVHTLLAAFLKNLRSAHFMEAAFSSYKK
jgi:hypothetical protein